MEALLKCGHVLQFVLFAQVRKINQQTSTVLSRPYSFEGVSELYTAAKQSRPCDPL